MVITFNLEEVSGRNFFAQLFRDFLWGKNKEITDKLIKERIEILSNEFNSKFKIVEV